MLHNNSFAKHAAKTALANNINAININQTKHRQPPAVPIHTQGEEIDKIVESVTNATKRLSQISTNTNNSKRKSKNHVGPWKLGRTLGRGSTGRVRLAKHSETGQLAAVKIVPKSKFQSNDSGSNSYGIEREIIIMKLISHENIMALYDVWENKGELYLVLEYVEGGELFDYLIKKGRLQEKEAIHYFKQIIKGVNYCHQFNICHRDLKPENLLLDKNLNIKIADFGMAALEINSKLLETSCGSPHYASPEIVTGKNYHGSPSDVWSCGIILFALLTGHLPFDDENIRKLLIKVQNGKFIMPNYLSQDAKDLIWKMMKINPNDRINIKDILKHPLLTKYDNDHSSLQNQTSLNDYYSKIDSLSLNESNIDMDILKSLSILFHGATQSNLIKKLIEPNSNPEKIFYYLLNDYKIKHQIHEKIEISHKNSKKKIIGNGDGTLKKSKSMVKTTIINEDGSKNIYEQPIQPPPTLSQRTSTSSTPAFGITSNNGRVIKPTIPNSSSKSSTISKKRVSKNLNGQIEIPVSNSYRRGVSFNNKDQAISRSSSRKSFTSINEKLKKNLSLLPPLPDVGIDWLNDDPKNRMSSNELAILCEEIFNYKTATPSPKKRTSPKKHPFMTSSPIASPKRSLRPKERIIKQEEEGEEEKVSKPIVESDQISTSTITPTKLKKEEEKLHIPRQLGNFEINSNPKRYSSEPARTLKPKVSTLDPKYKKRGISNDNAEILGKFGVTLNNSRNSKIFISKSSTTVNLNSIIKQESTNKIKKEVNPELPDYRISSSNYNSEIETEMDDSFNTINQTPQFNKVKDESFYFEVPTKTEIATAIKFSNGSNLTVQNNSTNPYTNESNSILNSNSFIHSKFADVESNQENFLKLSNSKSSVIKHHKRAVSNQDDFQDLLHQPQQQNDYRGSLYNNSNNTKDENLPIVGRLSKIYRNKQPSIMEHDDGINDLSIETNSIFADNTIDETDVTQANNNARVTTIFDDEVEVEQEEPITKHENNSYETVGASSVVYSPDTKRQNSQLKRSPLRAMNGSTLRTSVVSPKIELQPKREAPKIPTDQEPKKLNWFTKIFNNLISSHNTTPAKIFKTTIPMNEIKRAIKLILQIRTKEGTLSLISETPTIITAKTLTSSSLSKSLKFQIEFDRDEIKLTKLGGSLKLFKKLINAIEFIIENEVEQYKENYKEKNEVVYRSEIQV